MSARDEGDGGVALEKANDAWSRQLLVMTRPVFSSEALKWAIFTANKVIFERCVLQQDVAGTSLRAGDKVERIELKFATDDWHARIYPTRADKGHPIAMNFCMAWGGLRPAK